MPRNPTVSNDVLLDRLTHLFRMVGYESASMARIAAATGLEKSSLYHRFPNGKQQMALEVTERVGATFANVVLAPALQHETPVAKRVETIAANLREFYKEGTMPCLLEALSVEAVNESISANLRSAAEAWIGVFAAIGVEAGMPRRRARQCAQDAVANIEGALVLARVTGDTTAFERSLKSLPNQLTSHDDQRN